MEVFYRCDLDGNGYLSRNEFNEFQLRTSGEDCDDEAWSVVKGMCLTLPLCIVSIVFERRNLMGINFPEQNKKTCFHFNVQTDLRKGKLSRITKYKYKNINTKYKPFGGKVTKFFPS